MNLPDPKAAGGGDFAPYLKAKDIPAKGKTKIVFTGDVRESSGKFGDGIDCGVKIGAKVFSMTIKFDSGNYRRVIESFGKDVKKWKGKIMLASRDEYLGNAYVKFLD